MIAIAQQLPRPIADYIDGYVARRRMQRLLRAVARAALFSVVWMLAWCAIDRFFTLEPGVRAIALGINIAIAVVILLRPVMRMLRRADVNIAAAEIERREPRWAQRLRTVASRIGGEGDDGSSRELLDALAVQVADEARDRNPAALVAWRPVVRPAVACLLWLVIAWMLSFSSWLDLSTLARRYVMPLAEIPPVTTTRLIVTPGDADVTQGDPLRVQATAIRLSSARSPAIHVRARSEAPNNQAWHVEPMTAMPDGKFEAQIARVDHDLEYVLTGGDARSDVYRVTMLPRPAVKQFHIRYTYPPHTGLAPRDVRNENGVIEAPVGTAIALAIETSEPLSYAIMTVGAESMRIAPASTTQPAVGQTSFTITEDRTYALRMVSHRGVSGVFRGGTIRAIADRAPVAQFRDFPGATAKREVSAGDVVPVPYQAVDDYGLARLDLDIRIIRKSGAQASASVGIALTRGHREQQGTQPLDLRKLGLNIGDALELRLEAEDRAGQFALSAPARLVVTSPASSQPTPPQRPPPPPPPAPPRAPSTLSSHPERTATPPFDPPGYEAAIRAYFDALRRATPPTTQP